MSAINLYPVDVNNDPIPSFDFSSSTGSALTPFGGNSDEQILYNLFSEMRSVNNNVLNVQAFFQAMMHLGSSQADCNNQNILQMLNGLQGPDGGSASEFMANQYAIWSFGSHNGDVNATAADINNMIAKLGPNAANNPILSDLTSTLTMLADKGNLANLTNEYMHNGVLSINLDTIPVNGVLPTPTAGGNWIPADQILFDQYVSGNVGTWMNGSNMKDQLRGLRLNMFDEELNNPEANKYGSFALLAILISMLEINDDESQQSGVSDNTRAQSGWTKEVAGINGNFNPDYFTPDAQGQKNAESWMDSLDRLSAELNINSNAGDVATSAKTSIDGIMNQKVLSPDGKTTITLRDLLNQSKASGDFSTLDTDLNTLSADPAAVIAPGTTNQIVDNITSLSKSLTSAGQTLTTKSNALAQTENSMENTLSQVLTALKKLLDAIISAISQS